MGIPPMDECLLHSTLNHGSTSRRSKTIWAQSSFRSSNEVLEKVAVFKAMYDTQAKLLVQQDAYKYVCGSG